MRGEREFTAGATAPEVGHNIRRAVVGHSISPLEGLSSTWNGGSRLRRGDGRSGAPRALIGGDVTRTDRMVSKAGAPYEEDQAFHVPGAEVTAASAVTSKPAMPKLRQRL
jgi:hypothetical protein